LVAHFVYAKGVDFFSYIVDTLFAISQNLRNSHLVLIMVAMTWRQVPVFGNDPSRFVAVITQSYCLFAVRVTGIALIAGTAMAACNPWNTTNWIQKVPHILILRLPFQKTKGHHPLNVLHWPYSKAFSTD